jgi:aryl-alcohol dehydrogenase-like predicted oxidoreductase
MSLSSHWGPSTDEQGHATLAKALEVGATFWDSAAVYGKGHNEKLIGEFFKQNPGARDKVFIASKCGFDVSGIRDWPDARRRRAM